MNKHVFLILAIFTTIYAPLYTMDADDAVTQQVKKDYNATEPEPGSFIAQVTHKALKLSGVRAKILQSEYVHTLSLALKKYGRDFLVFENKEQPELPFDSLHECAHIHFDHHSKRARFARLVVVVSCIINAVADWTVFSKLKSKLTFLPTTIITGMFAAAGVGVTLMLDGMLCLYKLRQTEAQADLFAGQILLKLNRPDLVLTELRYWLNDSEHPFPPLFIDHPTNFARAESMLKLLQNGGFKLKFLPDDFPTDAEKTFPVSGLVPSLKHDLPELLRQNGLSKYLDIVS